MATITATLNVSSSDLSSSSLFPPWNKWSPNITMSKLFGYSSFKKFINELIFLEVHLNVSFKFLSLFLHFGSKYPYGEWVSVVNIVKLKSSLFFFNFNSLFLAKSIKKLSCGEPPQDPGSKGIDKFSYSSFPYTSS